MPQGKDWYIFLNNGENKMELELIHFLANHHNSDSVRSKLDIPLVLIESTNAWLITSANVSETDTRDMKYCPCASVYKISSHYLYSFWRYVIVYAKNYGGHVT